MPTRAVSLAVARPVGISWSGLGKILRECWAQTTCLANAAVTELARRDITRTPGMEKLPPWEAVNLYEWFTGVKGQPKSGKRTAPERIGPGYSDQDFWRGAKISVASILRAVQRKYLDERREVVWERPQQSSWPSEGKEVTTELWCEYS